MGNFELELITERLARATPEEVFGPIADLKVCRREFLRLSKVAHPDRYVNLKEKELATSTFKRLAELWELAQKRLEAGIYGKDALLPESFIVRSKRGMYVVKEALARGDVCDLFSCIGGEVLKIVRQPKDNDLVVKEARVLQQLHTGEHERFRIYIPQLVDSFGIKEGSRLRMANVLRTPPEFLPLTEARRRLPDGFTARHMAWVYRRLLTGIGFAHLNGITHGAILPTHILIDPINRGLILIDWTAATIEGQRLRIVSNAYRDWYPPEVFDKSAKIDKTLDIYMATKTMLYLLGDTPRPIRAFLNGCALVKPNQRPNDAWALKEEFDELIEKLWGRRTYKPLVIPA